MNKIRKDGIPIVKAFKIGKSVKFWCPFCNRWHIHGGEPDRQWEGHRVAHCINEQSPYKETGYILKRYTQAELKAIKEG